ncbi:MAG: sugar transferase [Lachnospiraceae bacterium]|nr:sugar transferase [Lachnospiraceae bacterium]
MYRKNKKAWYKHIDFMLLDLVCIEFSFIIALAIRFGIGVFVNILQDTVWAMPYHRIMVMILGLHLALVFFFEPYSGILKRNMAEETKAVTLYNLYILVGLVLILFAEQSSDIYSRIVVFATPLIDTIMMLVYKYGYKKYLRKHINKSHNQNNMLLVAPVGRVHDILHKFENNPINTVKIVGIVLVDDRAEDVIVPEAAITLEEEIKNVVSVHMDKKSAAREEIKGIPVVGTLSDPYDFARANVVDEVLICMESSVAERLADGYIDMGITVHVSIRDMVRLPKATMNKVSGISVITASVNTITTRQLIVKRMVDVACGLVGSLVTILLTLIIGPAILIADPGPIFFRQERVGKNGRTFKIWKFRTMYKDAEARKAELMAQNKMSGLMFKMDEDPRIIGAGKKFSLGKFLRETSLDELPQSFNILAGSMSVVGTRPPTVNEYKEYELHHKGRLATKPGLTGMWQVSGRSSITDFEEVVRLDKEYIANFSLALDFEIMLKTFKVVLGKEGSV